MIVINNVPKEDKEIEFARFVEKIWWLNNITNSGFGQANNIGFAMAEGQYILLLNSDMVIPCGTIEASIIELEKEKKIGALGCKLVNEDGSFQKSTNSIARFRGLLDLNLVFNYFIKPGKPRVEAVQGSFMLMPQKVLQEVGGFDPDFFMYSEELELCHRIAKKGYKIHYFEQVAAIHKHGGSITNKGWGLKQRYLSNALLYYKVRGIFGYFLYHLLFLLNTGTNFFAMWLLDKNYRNGYWQIQKAYFSNFTHYLKIPFLYGRKPGNGKRMLRAG